MAKEINLVPDIKNEMILALKRRNLIFFVCIAVVTVSLGVLAFFGMILGGQQLSLSGKANMIKEMSTKINSYTDLSDFLTVRNQLDKLASISNDKLLLSRTFGILSAMLPTGEDKIKISALNVSFINKTPVISFEAQADAGKAPFIDYNVLDAFKKSMPYMRYDYGRYVDKFGKEIPAYCMIENGADGATLTDPEKGVYAMWMIDEEGCNPSEAETTMPEETTEKPEEEATEKNTDETTNETTTGETEGTTTEKTTPVEQTEQTKPTEQPLETEKPVELKGKYTGYEYEDFNGKMMVRIWRTPQYNEWNQNGHMTTDGRFVDIQHFESNCTKYSGNEDAEGNIKWTETNESCLLVPGGVDGMNIKESTNARDSSSHQLVLRFTASIELSIEAFRAKNKHLLAIAPSGRRNVTDSYVQIQAMFSKRAEDCLPGDTTCQGGQ